MIKKNILYTKDHEWISYELNNEICFIGITSYAQEQLGDITFVDIKDKKSFETGDVLGEIESVKSVSDLIAPISGEIIEQNPLIIESPETINSDPYDKGWILKYRLKNKLTTDKLLTEEQYKSYLKSQS